MAHYTTPAATSLANIHQEGPFVTPGTFSHPTIVKQQHLSNIQRNIFLQTPGPEYNHYSTTASIPTPFLPYNGTGMEYNIVGKRKLQQQEDKTTMPIDSIMRHLIDLESRKSCLEAKIGSLQKELDEIKESIRIIKELDSKNAAESFPLKVVRHRYRF